jgi:hypothetical protein
MPPGTSRTTIALAITDVLMPYAAADLAGLDERVMWRLIRRRAFPMPLLIRRNGGRYPIPCFERRVVERWRAGNELREKNHEVQIVEKTPQFAGPRPRLERPR